MKTTLKKYGANSQAVVIPKAIANLFNFSASSQATFEPKEGELVIHIKSDESVKMEKAIEKMDQKYGKLFKRLADK